MKLLRIVYAAVSCAMFAGVAVQVFLAGFAIFGGSNFEVHVGFGYLLGLIVFVQVIAALAARAPRRLLAITGLLVLLTNLQPVFIAVGKPPDGVAALGALHPVNAMFIFAIASFVAWRSVAVATVARPDTSMRSASVEGTGSEVQP